MRTFKSLLLILCLAVPGLLLAQALVGDIEGTVLDPSGALVPNGKVTIRDLATGATREMTADSRGQFIFTQLALGNYEVGIEVEGFRRFTTTVLVKSGERTRVNATLDLGSVREELVVEAAAGVALNVSDGQLALSIDEKRVRELPLITRDPLTLAALSPGVTPVTPNNPFLGSGSFNSQGGRGRGNNITVDGITASDVSTTGGAGTGTISLDAIQEFKVITNNFSAEFGRNSSSQVQIITKSGTNQYHGTAYWFHQNAWLNARDYFDTTGEATPFIRNLFGFTAGGPIMKDRAFVFGHYEGLRIVGAGDTRTATVPTPAQAASITDPTSRAVFDSLQWPTSPTGSVNNAGPNSTETNAFSVRGDYYWRQGKDIAGGRFGFQDVTAISPGLTFIETNLPNFGASAVNTPKNVNLYQTHIFSPNIVNRFTFGYGRSEPNFAANTILSEPFAPEIRVTGFAITGVSRLLPQGRIQNTFQYSDQVTWSVGRHTWKFGFDALRVRADSFFDANFRGIAFFASWDSFAAGTPFFWSQNVGSSGRGNRSWDYFFFGQDDFRVTPTFTLNLGLRLESSGGVSEIQDRLSNLNFRQPGPIGGAGPGALGSFDLGGSAFGRNYNWAPRFGFAWNPNQGNYVVRGGYGWAYDFIFLNPITNLRFVTPFITSASTSNFTVNPWSALVAGTAQSQADALAAVGAFNPAQTNFGSLSPVDQQLANPRVQQWNLTLQYEAWKEWVFKAGYSGTKGTQLQISRQINPIADVNRPAPATSEADEFARRTSFLAAFNGATGAATGSSNRIDPRLNSVALVESSGKSIYHGLQLEAAKRFTRGYQVQAAYTWSHAIDDGSDVLGVLVNDSPTGQDPRAKNNDRGSSQFDIRQRFVINHVWEPQWASGLKGPAGKLLHGWGFHGIYQTQTGFPANIFAGTRRGFNDGLLLGSSNIRANVTGDLSSFTPVPQGSTGVSSIPGTCARGVVTTNAGAICSNTSGFPLTQPLIGSAGNLGRNVLRLNRLTQFDWAVVKNTYITETHYVQFRFEMFNVFNNKAFARFVNSLSSTAFGQYQGTDTDSRRLQISLRYIF